MKKYIGIYQFSAGSFGTLISKDEKTEHIERIFGVVGVTEITGK